MSLFPELDEPDPPPQARRLAPRLRALAAEGIAFGTSSWKYEGWLGSIYSPDRYQARGRHSRKRFDETCLTEYAATFPTVCGDFAFYQFPSAQYWAKLFAAVPPSFRFAFKVPEDITVLDWPSHARYGPRAGTRNPHFLDAPAFTRHFARPLETYRDQVATLIFEFGTFPRSTFPTPEAFAAHLEPFLAALPPGFRYAVEIRNPEFLAPAYFNALAAHNVAHVYNAWTRMPELPDQVARPETETADFTVARALLTKGRPYAEAVQKFEPYRLAQEPNEGARSGLAQIADRARKARRPAFLFINNRLEGNAPTTIEAVLDRLDAPSR